MKGKFIKFYRLINHIKFNICNIICRLEPFLKKRSILQDIKTDKVLLGVSVIFLTAMKNKLTKIHHLNLLQQLSEVSSCRQTDIQMLSKAILNAEHDWVECDDEFVEDSEAGL